MNVRTIRSGQGNQQVSGVRGSRGLGLSLADEDACCEDEASADDDLQAGESEAGLEVFMADEGDEDEFDSDDAVGPGEGGVDIGDEERKGVEEAAEKGHQAGDYATEDGFSASGERAVVGEAF